MRQTKYCLMCIMMRKILIKCYTWIHIKCTRRRNHAEWRNNSANVEMLVLPCMPITHSHFPYGKWKVFGENRALNIFVETYIDAHMYWWVDMYVCVYVIHISFDRKQNQSNQCMVSWIRRVFIFYSPAIQYTIHYTHRFFTRMA